MTRLIGRPDLRRAALSLGFFIAIVLGTIGCSESPGSEEDASDTGSSTDVGDVHGGVGSAVALEEFAETMADITCSKFERCCSAAEKREIGFAYRDSCVENYSERLEGAYTEDVRDSRQAGRVGYDAEKMADCLRRIQRRGCSSYPYPGEGAEVNECLAPPLRPELKVGDSCERSFECENAACRETSSGGETCRTLGGSGDSCTYHEHCKSGFYCDDSTCTEKHAGGESCSADWECKGMICAPSSKPSEICTQKLSGGEECGEDSDCQSGSCATPDGGLVGTCRSTEFCDGS